MIRQAMNLPEGRGPGRRNASARAGMLLALLLTLTTGLFVGQLRIVGESRSIATPVRTNETTDLSLVSAFYSAVNLAIGSGDVGELRQMLSVNFVDHSPFGRASGDAATFERYLLALHQRMPGAYLDVKDVTSEGGLVAISLRLSGERALRVSGLPLSSPNTDSYELLRLERGEVTERWASPALPPFVESLGVLELGPNSYQLGEPRVERVTFAPRAELTIPVHNGIVLVVESGSVQLTIHGRNTNSDVFTEAGTPVPGPGEATKRLEAGDTNSIPANEGFRIGNPTEAPAVLLWLSVRLLDTVALTTTQAENPAPGVTVELLAGGAVSRVDSRPVAFVAERLVAPPGTVIDGHDVENTEILLVTRGLVQVELREGLALRVVDGGAITVHKEPFALAQDQAVSLSERAVLGYRTTGDEFTELWVITMRPVETM